MSIWIVDEDDVPFQPVPSAVPNADAWLATYNAVIQGGAAGVLEWAARGTGAFTDAEADLLMTRIEAMARRSADRQHGPYTPPGPATEQEALP